MDPLARAAEAARAGPWTIAPHAATGPEPSTGTDPVSAPLPRACSAIELRGPGLSCLTSRAGRPGLEPGELRGQNPAGLPIPPAAIVSPCQVYRILIT